MGDAKWVQYLCGLGFSVDFVHRLGAGIDSMGKLLFHVLIGLCYFPNTEERITDCISISDCICSNQELSPDRVSHLNTHPSDEPSQDHGRGTASGKAGQFCHTEHAQARKCSSLTGTCSILHTNWDQFEIQPRHFSMTRVMWKAAALTATFSNDSGNFLSEALRNAWLKDEQVSIRCGRCTKISARHQGYNNTGCHLSSLRGFCFSSEKTTLYSKATGSFRIKGSMFAHKKNIFCSKWPRKACPALVLV